MRRRLIALASAAALVVLTVAPTAAITKNYRDDAEHPFVGLAAFYDADWEFLHRCTAELLSPTVALTAGHCTDDGDPETPAGTNAAHARIWFLQDVGSHYDAVTQLDPVTGYPESCTGTMGNGLGIWCAEGSELYNYGFNNFAGFPDVHDVGIVILDQPIDVPEYASLASAATVEALIKARGTQDTTMRVSGYGLSLRHLVPAHGPIAGAAPSSYTISFRIRLQADMKFTNLQSANADGYTLVAEGNGNDQGGTCNGDSGGPVFWPADSNTVVAVSSWGILNAGCRGVGYYYRTDRADVLEWIEEVVG
ncbi:MAG TPA: trypsin-like serine protease, partial [Candidatus Limnocylindrales bacterium]|nr:trypsin-like serine protease [Candidatus Limnocylindrales bacterium]